VGEGQGGRGFVGLRREKFGNGRPLLEGEARFFGKKGALSDRKLGEAERSAFLGFELVLANWGHVREEGIFQLMKWLKGLSKEMALSPSRWQGAILSPHADFGA
jgi:hypothetical protein